jgi:hypothetical protein
MSIKKALFETLLSEENVLVEFYPDHNTKIPEFLITPNTGMIRFQYGLDMPTPIPDLLLTEKGIEATLSFNQTPHHTFVPWTQIFAMHTDNINVVFRNIPGTKPSPPTVTDTKPRLTLVK